VINVHSLVTLIRDPGALLDLTQTLRRKSIGKVRRGEVIVFMAQSGFAFCMDGKSILNGEVVKGF
jgi:hypothetical protein